MATPTAAEAHETHEEKAAHCVLFLGIPLSQHPRKGIWAH